MSDTPSVAERLESLAGDRVRAIEALQDFQVFTGHSYDRYSKMVAAGHIKETITNSRTGTSLLANELAEKLLLLLDIQLPTVCLYELIALLEAFEADLLRLLRKAPGATLGQVGSPQLCTRPGLRWGTRLRTLF